jgi:hypothetical protein
MTLTIYYLQGNGQAKSTNKVIGLLLIKLVNGNCTNWDEHLHMVFICLSHNIQNNHWTHTISVGLWPLPFDANTIFILPMNNSPFDQNFSPTYIFTSRNWST